MIDLLFIADEEEVFVELDSSGTTTKELIQEGRDILKDWGFEGIHFVNFFTVEEAERMGLDTY